MGNQKWNWQQPEWPDFIYELTSLEDKEHRFLHKVALFLEAYNSLDEHKEGQFMLEVLSREALLTSEIEGVYLNLSDLKSSFLSFCQPDQRQPDVQEVSPATTGITRSIIDLHTTYASRLNHQMLHRWHKKTMLGRTDLRSVGSYRQDPVVIAAGSRIIFEPPPAERIGQEMDSFVHWFNRTSPNGDSPLPALTRAGIAHLYFECIHPFEDGNGRVGRAVSEKALAQSIGNYIQ